MMTEHGRSPMSVIKALATFLKVSRRARPEQRPRTQPPIAKDAWLTVTHRFKADAFYDPNFLKAATIGFENDLRRKFDEYKEVHGQ